MQTLSDKSLDEGELHCGIGGLYLQSDVKEFIKQLKEEVEKAVNSDKSTRAQWIYPRIIEKINYKIDKLAGEKLCKP